MECIARLKKRKMIKRQRKCIELEKKDYKNYLPSLGNSQGPLMNPVVEYEYIEARSSCLSSIGRQTTELTVVDDDAEDFFIVVKLWQ